MPRYRKRYGRNRVSRCRALPVALTVIFAAVGIICLAGLLQPAAASASAAVSAIQAAAPAATASPEPSPTPAPTPQVSTVRFSASGDNLIHSKIYQQAAENAKDGAAYDFSSCYENVAPFFANFDVNWINQESLVNDTLPPSTYPCFSTPGECARTLYDIGFRVFSLSNNHTYDKGDAGIRATEAFWSSMPKDVVTTGLWAGGSDCDRIPLQEVNGVTIAYLSYTEQTNGNRVSSDCPATVILTSQTDLIAHQVQLAAQQADFVVVGVHWGVEYSHARSDAQKALAQNLANWGADVIIGTHPHVLQDAEWLTAEDGRQTFVAYSLGNFLSTQRKADTMAGAILTCTLQKTTDPDGTVSCAVEGPALHPVITHYTSGVHNITNYLYRDYTQELASQHGIRAYDSKFSYQYITEMIQNTVNQAYLDLT